MNTLTEIEVKRPMTFPRVNILITDDHRMFAEGLRTMLMIRKKLGNPRIADSAEQALEMIKEEKCDLLITEVSMPSISGLDLAKMVKKEYPDVKILMVTPEEDINIIHDIITAKADGYILKTSAPEKFFDAVERILDK